MIKFTLVSSAAAAIVASGSAAVTTSGPAATTSAPLSTKGPLGTESVHAKPSLSPMGPTIPQSGNHLPGMQGMPTDQGMPSMGMPTGKGMPPMGMPPGKGMPPMPPGMAPVPPMGSSFGPQGPSAFSANGPKNGANGPFDLADFLNAVVGAAENGFPAGPPLPSGPQFLPGPPMPPGPGPKGFNGPQSGPQSFGGPFDGPFGGPHDFVVDEDVQDYTDSVDDYSSGSQDSTEDFVQDYTEDFVQDYTEEYSGSEEFWPVENSLPQPQPRPQPQMIGGAEARSGMVEFQASSSSGNTWVFASASDSTSVNGPAGGHGPQGFFPSPQGPQGPMSGNGPSQGGWNFRKFDTNQQGPQDSNQGSQGNSWSFPSPGGPPPPPPGFGPAGKPQGPFPPVFPGGNNPSDQQLLTTLLTEKLAEDEAQLSTEEAQGGF